MKAKARLTGSLCGLWARRVTAMRSARACAFQPGDWHRARKSEAAAASCPTTTSACTLVSAGKSELNLSKSAGRAGWWRNLWTCERISFSGLRKGKELRRSRRQELFQSISAVCIRRFWFVAGGLHRDKETTETLRQENDPTL